MSYKLFRLHWKIVKNGVVIKETYSFHKNEEIAGEFARENMQNQHKDRENYISTIGAGNEIKTHDGHLVGKVLASKKLSLWEDEVKTHQNSGELALS